MYSDVEREEMGEAVVTRDLDVECPVAVSFEHVTKQYKLYKNDRQRLAGIFNKNVACERINANDDLSFTVGRGEGVAFLGDNGSGKSTALKMITGVCFPTSGNIEVHGRIAALLELSAGFDARLTGMENLRMRCQIWGLSEEETEAYIPEMVEFSEVGSYIDQPMRTYSSGMKSRLGFAFASSIRPDILVVDEALSVGDRKFSKKCRNRVREIMENENVTVLFVTHSTRQAQDFCERGIVLEHGMAVYEGDIADAVAFYESRDDDVPPAAKAAEQVVAAEAAEGETTGEEKSAEGEGSSEEKPAEEKPAEEKPAEPEEAAASENAPSTSEEAPAAAEAAPEQRA